MKSTFVEEIIRLLNKLQIGIFSNQPGCFLTHLNFTLYDREKVNQFIEGTELFEVRIRQHDIKICRKATNKLLFDIDLKLNPNCFV